MKSYYLFGVLAAGVTTMAAFGGGCTVTTVNNGPGEDGGSSSGSSGATDDSSTASDSPSGSSSGSSSSGSSSRASSSSSSGVSEGGGEGEGGTCAAATVFDPPACETCMKAKCCSALLTCEAPDDAGVNDAGASACSQLFQCAIDYVAASDGGSTLDDAVATCTGGTTTNASTLLGAVLTCATNSCASACN